MQKPPTIVELRWEHDLVFSGTSGNLNLILDSSSKAGPSPMQALAFGLAGCMAMDVAHVVAKGRFKINGIGAKLTGQRAIEEPRRFTSIALHFTIDGEVPTDKIERAIALSRDKYCSVWHSMRQDIEFITTYEIRA